MASPMIRTFGVLRLGASVAVAGAALVASVGRATALQDASGSARAAATRPGFECDRDHAHPYDPEKPDDVRGVDGLRARSPYASSCAAAVAENPDVARFRYNEARAHVLVPSMTGAIRSNARLWDVARGQASPGGLDETEREAVRWLSALNELADAGYAAAGYTLADQLNRAGLPDRAARLFRGLADEGDGYAMAALGRMYDLGVGVPRNLDTATEWIRRSADQGHPLGQLLLGWRYLEGRGVPEDEAEGASWILRAAEQGDAWAQTDMGVLYQHGIGVPKDDSLAFRMFYAAGFEQPGGYEGGGFWGDRQARARAEVGWAYREGRGVAQDVDRGTDLLWEAALNGDDLAILQMAAIRASGELGGNGREEAARELDSALDMRRIDDPEMYRRGVELYQAIAGEPYDGVDDLAEYVQGQRNRANDQDVALGVAAILGIAALIAAGSDDAGPRSRISEDVHEDYYRIMLDPYTAGSSRFWSNEGIMSCC